MNPEEAEQVREVFRFYLQHRSLVEVMRELDDRGWRTKSWTTKGGKFREGRPWTKWRLHRVLTNIVYLGKVPSASVVCMGMLLSGLAHDDLGFASGAPSGWNGISLLFTYPVEVRNACPPKLPAKAGRTGVRSKPADRL